MLCLIHTLLVDHLIMQASALPRGDPTSPRSLHISELSGHAMLGRSRLFRKTSMCSACSHGGRLTVGDHEATEHARACCSKLAWLFLGLMLQSSAYLAVPGQQSLDTGHALHMTWPRSLLHVHHFCHARHSMTACHHQRHSRFDSHRPVVGLPVYRTVLSHILAGADVSICTVGQGYVVLSQAAVYTCSSKKLCIIK